VKAPLGGSDVHEVAQNSPQPSAKRTRLQRRPLHGVLLLDKPLGLSSNQALQKVKWLLRAEKAGHTGTLDPLASGVLPICFGAATKFSQMHLDAHKTYEATLRLGIKTSTADAEGEVLQRRPVHVSAETVQATLARFTGPLAQIPPMHSALKKDGRALYSYARAGLEVERPARNITIYSLAWLQEAGDLEREAIKIVVHCSKGTYIRTLGEDIGEALGCGAHLSALRRTRTGDFDVQQVFTLDALEAMDEAQRMRCLLPTQTLLNGHGVVTLANDDAARFLSGVRRRGDWPDAAQVAVFAQAPSALLGSGHVKSGELIPGRLLSPPEVSESLLQFASLAENNALEN
jgi:tRNA pseudouridine55 synthase